MCKGVILFTPYSFIPMNIITTLIILILGIIITAVICYFLPKEKIRKENQELIDKEHKIELLIKDKEKELADLQNQFSQELNSQNQKLQDDLRKWEDEKSSKNINFLKAEMQLKEEIANLEGLLEEKKNSINQLDEQSASALKTLETRSYDLMIKELEEKAATVRQAYAQAMDGAQKEYQILLGELAEEYQLKNTDNILKYEQLLEQLKEAQAKANAITESNKKAELEKEKKDFYRLQLSDIDIEEIKKIRSIEPFLRKKEPLNKVIWKVYYEKPYTDLIGRVVGTKVKIGIYKITNLENGMVYIGQSNNIAERWRQHIKRGVGADPPTQNKLYPAMLEYGAENFTFEIVEECPIDKLTEREKYYTDVFQANSYGYVVRKG